MTKSIPFKKGEWVVWGPDKEIGKVYKDVKDGDTLVSVEAYDKEDPDNDRPYLYYVTRACIRRFNE